MSHLPACPSAAWSANRDRYHQTSGGFSPRGRFKKNWGKNARQRLQLGKGMGNRKNWKLEKYSDLLEYNVSNSVQQQLWITSKVWFINMLKKFTWKPRNQENELWNSRVQQKNIQTPFLPKPESRTQFCTFPSGSFLGISIPSLDIYATPIPTFIVIPLNKNSKPIVAPKSKPTNINQQWKPTVIKATVNIYTYHINQCHQDQHDHTMFAHVLGCPNIPFPKRFPFFRFQRSRKLLSWPKKRPTVDSQESSGKWRFIVYSI